MRFSAFAAACLSMVSIARAVDTNMATCTNQGPWVLAIAAGNGWPNTHDEEHHCEAGFSDGDVLTGIKIWKGPWQILAVQLRWGSHDYGVIYGSPKHVNDKPDKTVEWDAATKVLIRLWNNAPDNDKPVDGVGKIQVEVDGVDPVNVRANKIGDEIRVDQGAGLIIAAMVSSGGWISTLQFNYLESHIVSTVMTEITFADTVAEFNKDRKGLVPAVIGNVYIKNSNPEGGPAEKYEQDSTVSQTTTMSVSTSTTHSFTASVGFKVSAKIGLPEVAETSIEASTEVGFGYTHSNEELSSISSTFSYSWHQGSESEADAIPPQHAVHCTVTATQGTFNSEYTAKITTTLDNGKTFTFNDFGNYNNINYADAQSDCILIPLSKVPAGQGEEANTPNSRRGVRRAIGFRA